MYKEEKEKKDMQLKFQNRVAIEKKIEYLETQRKRKDLFHAVILMIGIFFTYAANSKIIVTFKIFQSGVHAMRNVTTLSCIFLLYLVKSHYTLKLEIMKLKKLIYHKTTLWQSSLRNWY